MYLFCRLLLEQKLDLHIPMVISGSEMLHDFQRTMIEETLGARLYNHYTHWERAASVLECDEGHLHAQEDYGYHEILDGDAKPVPPGVPGEVTVTGLHNLAMPIIRYRTGDIASWSLETCSCGQSFPVISRIEGRQNDYLISQQGGITAGTSALYDLKNIPNILYFQVIQREIDLVEARIVKSKEFNEIEDTQRVWEALASRLGESVTVKVRFCDVKDLVRNPVGKIRSCFNELPPEIVSQYVLPPTKGKNMN
jgi:phenylacetate-CoA ligase